MRTKTSTLWLSIAYAVILPLASPYGIGRTTVSAAIAPSKHNSHSQFSPSRTRNPLQVPKSAATNESSTRLQSSAVINSEINGGDNLRGEYQSSILSRMLYNYVDPLLKISKKRQLEEGDIFPSKDAIKMDHQVPELEKIYSKCKSKAKRKLEQMRSHSANASDKSLADSIEEKLSTSESLTLAKALFIHQKGNVAKTGILRLLNTLIQAFPAILVSRLLKLIESGDMHHPSKAIRAAFDLVAVLSIKMVIENAYFHSIVKCSTMVRGSLSGLIFDKSLRVSSRQNIGSDSSKNDEKDDKKKKSVGESSSVLNLMQSDVSTIEMTSLQIHTLWDGILQICIYSSLLYKYLGPSVFAGISVLLLTIPTNALCLRVLNRLSKYESEAKDVRTRKTVEAITNMKLLKLQAWEREFEKKIEDARKEEIKRHIARGAFRALNQAISNAVPAIVLVVTLTAYQKTGRPIVASTIFTAISLFNQLRFPLLFYPMVIDSIANGKNALRRLSKYLCQEDLTPYVAHLPKTNGEGRITLENGNFLWAKPTRAKNGETTSIPSAALCGANLTVNGGEIVAVVGPVGSGKSCLVRSLLGELEPVPRVIVDPTATEGSMSDVTRVALNGDVAYCAQEAWLTKGTLKDAILFGREFDERRFRNALYDAGLDEDISQGTISYSTDVGEGGSSLSGGQRARVSLARALYNEDAGVYILDDVLSALDVKVSALVFDRVSKRLKERNAAVIFVTNDISLPRRCDKVVLMGKMKSDCSKIEDIGTFDELISRGHDLRSISIDSEHLKSDENQESDPTSEKEKDMVSQSTMKNMIVEESNTRDSPRTVTQLNNSTVASDTSSEVGDDKEAESEKKDGKGLRTIDDKMSEGAVPIATYMTYLKSVRNPLLISAALGCYLLSNGAQFFQQYTVAKWTELGVETASALGSKYLQSLVYAAGVVSFTLWLRSFLLMRVGSKASEFIHNKMLASVFNAPVTFFDSTPSGQLLSRFGKELETVDRGVPDGIGSVLFCFLNIAITVAGLTSLMTPGLVVPLLFISIFYTNIMAKFRPAARDLKRFESKSRSPIYTQFQEALKGAETIRSIPQSPKRWSNGLRKLVDDNLNVVYTVKSLDRWLSVRLETLGNVVVLTAAFASVFLTRMGKMKSGSAGWGLTQSLAITGLLTWAVRVLTDLESQMLSVQRVTEITDLNSKPSHDNLPVNIPQEKSKIGEALHELDQNKKIILSMNPKNDAGLISSGWPWRGSINFKNVSMRYSESAPLALKNVNLSIKPGSTLGIVGRTGSGKSTLLLTLFRLVEIESGGAIEIDGVDVRSLSLQSLRKSLSIIPQDPVLFEGTLKYNLDATGNASEEDCWQALEKASPDLARQYRSSDGLDSMISEGGKNISAGQRQLICLARALLRKSRILVLDEATSSVDANTDAQVQNTIKKEFVEKGATVIIVAHRLDTVLDSDKIVVMGDGKVIEYGKPSDLLKINNGQLRTMVDADLRNKKKGASTNKKSPIEKEEPLLA